MSVASSSIWSGIGNSVQHVIENLVRGKGKINTALTSVPVKAIEAHVTGAVTVPAIGTAGLGGTVNVTVAGVAVGDVVLAVSSATSAGTAYPSNCVTTGARVSATDTVTLSFQAVGGTVSSTAGCLFNLVIADLT